MSPFSVCERNNEAGDLADFICDYGNLPAVVRIGHKETSQCTVCGKLPGVEENLLAVCGYGSGDDRGVYGGKSREEETGEKVQSVFCGGKIRRDSECGGSRRKREQKEAIGLTYEKRYAKILRKVCELYAF